MKTIIKPYILSLIKENAIYLILGSVLILIEIIFVPMNIDKINKNVSRVDSLSHDINDLNNKLGVFNTITFTPDEIDANVKVLNKLIPNSEDYFSIIYALEKLSKQTNFVITSYSMNIKDSTNERLKLSITGTGNKETFLKFLQDYNFGGDRLITSDRIELSQQFSGQLKIDVTFYNSKTKADTNGSINFSKNLLNTLQLIQDKVSQSKNESSNSAVVDVSYPRKVNPF